MKCISCEEEISSKFKHAIESNSCPFCGNNITDEVLNELFKDLFGIILKFEDYKTELEEWMKENLKMVPIQSLKKKSTKSSIDDLEEDDIEIDEDGNVVKKKITNYVNNAMRNSGTSVQRQQDLRKLAAKIMSDNEGTTTNVGLDESDDDDSSLDDEDKIAIQAEIANRQFVPQQKTTLTGSDYFARIKMQQEAARQVFIK